MRAGCALNLISIIHTNVIIASAAKQSASDGAVLTSFKNNPSSMGSPHSNLQDSTLLLFQREYNRRLQIAAPEPLLPSIINHPSKTVNYPVGVTLL